MTVLTRAFNRMRISALWSSYVATVLRQPAMSVTQSSSTGPDRIPAPSAGSTGERNPTLSIDDTEIESLEKRLAYYVGPVAKYLVKRAAQRATTRDELTQLLAIEVDGALARKQFLEACRNPRAPR